MIQRKRAKYYLHILARVLAVFSLDVERAASYGLIEKARGLTEAAAAAGHEVTVALTKGTHILLFAAERWPTFDAPIQHQSALTRYRGALYRLFGFWSALAEHVQRTHYRAVWVRAHPISTPQARLIAAAVSVGTSVLYDIPTYPFSHERKSIVRQLANAVTRPLASIAPLVERFVTLSSHTTIEGTPTLRVRNGVTVSTTAPRAPARDGPMRVTGLGQWSDYHGLDRLLRVVSRHPAAYELKLAGSGPHVRTSAALAKRLGVQVEWLPPVFGSQRDDLLAWADVAVGVLAIYRKRVFPDQALKHRVYAAAGLPFICTQADPHWLGVPGVLQVPNDDSELDESTFAPTIADFRKNRRTLAQGLRVAAVEASWQRTYTPLFTYLDTLA